MIQKIRKSVATVVASLALAIIPAMTLVPTAAFAVDENIQGGLKCGSTLSLDTEADCNVEAGTEGINDIITTIINIFSVIVGVVSVIMIIYGGFRYVTSGGDSSNVQSAKNTIIYAVIGLVVVALAQFIVQFVLDNVTE